MRRDTLRGHGTLQLSSPVRYLPLILLVMLLAACAAPPTPEQATSIAIRRNCEAQAAAAADEVRKQNVQVTKESRAVSQDDKDGIEAKATQAQATTFKSCVLKYAV